MKALLIASWFFIYFLSHLHAQDSLQLNKQVSRGIVKAPSFPGGEKKFEEYITLHMHNTEMAIGSIVVQFEVQEDGSLSDFEIIKSLCPLCDREALRVMRNCPHWLPGERDGKKVRMSQVVQLKY